MIFFYKSKKDKNSFESIRNYEKKIMLRTSDTWSMSHLPYGTKDPEYNIEDCRISRLK